MRFLLRQVGEGTFRLSEPLEPRIAPAIFYVSGVDLTVRNAAGDELSESAALVGATKFIRLSAGDQLLFDTDGDQKFEPFDPADATQHDVKLIKVTSGRAMVFLRDNNGNGRFGPNEISGLAVSDKIGAQIFTDVYGDIVTALDSVGNLQFNSNTNTITLVPTASIASLAITGRVVGDILAGKNIAHVSIGSGVYSTGESVSTMYAGTAAPMSNTSFGSSSLGSAADCAAFAARSR